MMSAVLFARVGQLPASQKIAHNIKKDERQAKKKRKERYIAADL